MDSPNGTEPPDASPRKRRRRRRRGPKPSDASADPKTASPDTASKASDQGGRRAGKGRGRGGRRPSNRAAKVLSKRTESIDLDANTEEPLGKQEIAALREHFTFLRAYRKDLRLKVNANEDLLLNGVREPIHRGVCLHLLGKVERRNVLAAADRLEPAAAAKLLAGVIRFSADIEYVLLFLEKINQSVSPTEATAALSQGLQRIEFEQVSSAQMRRVLQLITELFGEDDRPALLLGMLESPSFRAAFDKSMSDLPEALSRLVVPLRAAQAVILHGKENTFDSQALSDGVNLLLSMDSKILLRHSVAMRDRLFQFGIQCCSDHRVHDRLKMLWRNFPSADPTYGDRGVALARHLIAAKADAEARLILEALVRDHSSSGTPARWLALLDAERLDRIALLDDGVEATDQHTRRKGVWLETLQPVWIQIASLDAVARHEETSRILNDLAIPGVAAILESGTTQNSEPYFVVSNSGESLARILREPQELGLALRICHEAVGLLSALAAVGIELPDVEPGRFVLESSGALLLIDVTGATRIEPEPTGGSHFELARSFCKVVLEQARRQIVPASVRLLVPDSKTCSELTTGFARERERAR